jgi:hypothetical protein
MKRLLLSSVLLGGAVVACGSLDGNTSRAPTLATIHGELTNPSSVAINGAVRVAVVWQGVTQGSFNVAQDLPVQPQFPAAFSIDLNGPPPAEAMQSGDALDQPTQSGGGSSSSSGGSAGGSSGTSSGTSSGSFGPGEGGSSSGSGQAAPLSSPTSPTATPTSAPSWQVAIGSVVAYVDENGNGKLDLVADGASGYIDRIAATNDKLLVVYLQGDFPVADLTKGASGTPALGYNLYTECSDTYVPPVSAGSRCANPPAPPAACTPTWSTIDTPISLAVANDPHVNSLMCLSNDQASSGGGSGGGITATQPSVYPDPCDPHVYCADDGSWYTFQTCTVSERGICEGTDTFCATSTYARPTPTPTGWPCK